MVAVVAVGNDARLLRSTLDKVRHDIELNSTMLVVAADIDIHRPMDLDGAFSPDDDDSEEAGEASWGYDPDHG